MPVVAFLGMLKHGVFEKFVETLECPYLVIELVHPGIGMLRVVVVVCCADIEALAPDVFH